MLTVTFDPPVADTFAVSASSLISDCFGSSVFFVASSLSSLAVQMPDLYMDHNEQIIFQDGKHMYYYTHGRWTCTLEQLYKKLSKS